MYAQYKLNTINHSSNQSPSTRQHNIKSVRLDTPAPIVENKGLEQTAIRHQWIAEAAYFKAEARGFEVGGALDDWLEAEQDYIKSMITEYLSVCEEDGGLTLVSLQQLARDIGVDHPEKITGIKQLVRSIQQASHERPCFRFERNLLCKDKNCQWSSECQKLIAVWLR